MSKLRHDLLDSGATVSVHLVVFLAELLAAVAGAQDLSIDNNVFEAREDASGWLACGFKYYFQKKRVVFGKMPGRRLSERDLP